MLNFTYFYDKLLSFYNVNTLKDLSEITNIPISTMSSIKQRNSITALKKKCRELGIYDEIFGDLNSKINVNSNSGQVAGTVHRNQEQRINYKEDEYIIPETILDDINILFKLAIENEKEDDLIELIDEFIFNTKKELRKK
ncbi:hypothetical protein [Aliarcobacter butzleri]|uniref:hypothetical protein n=1 Tax=Aliarcobacter butzleri TaxID=28197 RepID=UPI001260E249|nr:hypothetical protein [Aliarcobacter butzleri]